jgi:hypothetical protein
LQDDIIKIDPVCFCKENPTWHYKCQEDYLPEASRFAQLEELDWAFGTMGTQDKGNIWLLYTLRIFLIL